MPVTSLALSLMALLLTLTLALSLLTLLALLALLAALLTLLPLLAGLLTLLASLTLLTLLATRSLSAILLTRLLTLLTLLVLLPTRLLTALATAPLRLALLAGLSLLLSSLTSLLTLLLAVLILALLARFNFSAQRLKIVGKLARAVQRFFQSFSLSPVFRASFCCLKVSENLFEITFDDSLALARLIVPTVGDQLLILADSVGDAILTNRAGGFAEFVARLLPVLPDAARRLIYVAFQAGDLISKRLFTLTDLLFLLFAGASGLSVARKLVHAA